MSREASNEGSRSVADAPPAYVAAPQTNDEASGAGDGQADERLALVSRAVKEWCGQLIDLGGRNTLLYFKDLKVGSLDLAGADSAGIDALLDGRTVTLSQLYTDQTARENAARRCRAVRAKGKENYEERGLRTLSLGAGIAGWSNTRGASIPAAPVLLRSVTLTPRGGGEEDFDFVLTDDWELNPTLLHMLRTEFGISVNDDDVIGCALDEAGHLSRSDVYERLRDAASDAVPDWAISDRVVVANFSYVKMPIVADLEGSIDTLAEHPLICALAGSHSDRQTLRSAQLGFDTEIDEAFADRQDPRDEFLVLDADASQSRVVNLAVRGANLVVQGPPGTGKSQTIANLIATLVARDRSVLFVAEKRAAIDAVLNNLRRRGLDDLVLDMHQGTGNRKRLGADLARTLQAMGSAGEPDVASMQAELRNRRDELNRHNEALHAKRAPFGVSAFDLQSMLLGVEPSSRSEVTLHGAELDALTPEALAIARDGLAEWVALDGPAIRSGLRPWSHAVARVTTGEQVQQIRDALTQLRMTTMPTVRDRLDAVLVACKLEGPDTLEDWAQVLELLAAVDATMAAFRPEVFTADLEGLLTGLAPAEGGPFGRASKTVFNKAYRRAKSEVAALALGSATPRSRRCGLQRVKEQRDAWMQRSPTGAEPHLPVGLDPAASAFSQLLKELAGFEGSFDSGLTHDLDLAGLSELLDALAADQVTLNRLPRVGELSRALSASGLGALLDDVARRGLSVESAEGSLSWVWAHSALSRVLSMDPSLGAFDGTHHSRIAREFVSRDEEQLLSNVQRVRRAVAVTALAARNDKREQSDVLERNAKLKRKHDSVRDLLQKAPDVLLALRPCWVMSPLVISQLLPSDRTYFDVVVFDEASQIRPADAVPALARGRQAIVAGDAKQLPPTSFFDVTATSDDDDSNAPTPLTQDMDSILDALGTLFPADLGTTTLNWHYRSRDERLIAFSNAQPELYDWSLTTFPGALGDGCLKHVEVPHRLGVGGTIDSSTDEVAAVVELVREHAREHPEESLGVIAMGRSHSDRIGETLRLARRDDQALDRFLDEAADEPFFVKNLERVQGDERDAILLTIGYPKTADGRMQYQFGPLNQEGGERRLNVAITRARNRMTVVSAFTPEDMDDDRLRSVGAQMLKRYLSYARSGGIELGQHAAAKPQLNGFEIDVKNRLSSAGIPLIAQYGVAGFWIDFAAKHPSRPGQMVLAIEADGASYHSSHTARERDRLRQSHLEGLGWKFHRIWSTDWFNHTEREVERAVAAYHAAVEAADRRREHPDVEDGLDDSLPALAHTGESSRPIRTARKPYVLMRRPIFEYSNSTLDSLCRWIKSDTLLRTDAELLDELICELGYRRRGKNIVARLELVISRTRATPVG